ncbi:MAG: winged helix-turn-helix domain-containing protein [Lachnospiraceae bacterium]|nr:winged helix-turn-helix domain-containing protein [Lachnospiraceae bacterium]
MDDHDKILAGIDMPVNDSASKSSNSARNNDNVFENDNNENKSEGVYTWGKLILNEKKRTVKYDNHEINLTNREFLMLMTLLANQDIVMTRDTLLEKVCGYDYIGETNVVDVYIRFLRSKIDEVFDVKMIQTVRGVGYVIKTE